MKAIILAAGRGTRMKALTVEKPKCLVELEGQSLLEKQLIALRGAGIDEIAIVTGYRRELLIPFGLVEFHNPRWNETNMVASLACAGLWLQSEPCLVSYSDIFYSVEAATSLINCHAPLAVTYDSNWLALWTKRFGDPLVDAETFRINSDGMLSEIGQKPKTVHEVEGQYMGLLRFTPQGWDEVQQIRIGLDSGTNDKIHMTDMLQKIIEKERLKVTAVPYQGEWGEVDSEEDLACYSNIKNK
jgi:L-glutamine-phosphate cytidylyltransferase